MKKILLLGVLVSIGSAAATWIWQVDIIPRTKGLKLQYEDYIIKPGVGGYAQELVGRGAILRHKNLWTYNRPGAIGRKIVIQSEAGLGAAPANETNKVIIARPEFISDEERKNSFIIPMTPSGSYHVIWDRRRPNVLTATQRHDIRSALENVYGAMR